MQINSFETCWCTVCANFDCNCHTATSKTVSDEQNCGMRHNVNDVIAPSFITAHS